MKETPFWHEAAPPAQASGSVAPEMTDVLVVGGGFTGLSCAKALADAGRNVVVFDMEAMGAGASTRNGGMLGWGHRGSVASLAKRYGEARARAMMIEARVSFEFTTELIATLPVDARYRKTGRFVGAASPSHFSKLAMWAANEAPALGMDVEMVGERDQRQFISTDLYHGGAFFPQHGGVHPALFHLGLVKSASAAGAVLVDHCPVTEISGAPGAWTVRHGQGQTEAREIVFAGNGYAGHAKGPFPVFSRRLIPIPSYIIATEKLGRNRMQGLIPQGSMIVETRSQHSYFRPDPDGERLLYGGRASLNVIDQKLSGPRLRAVMLSVFPELDDVAVTHSWRGNVAFTFDNAPHVGQMEGVWYACGYNGSGVAMAPYLGWRLAQKILGTDQGETGFDPNPFITQPLYGGNPWFLRVVELWMKAKDRLQGVSAVRRPRR